MVVEGIPKDVPETEDSKDVQKGEETKTFTFESILFVHCFVEHMFR